MNIAFIGPGIMPIPPDGWGAVEMLIWDYATVLGELGHTGAIINTPDRSQIIEELKEEEFDIVHLHYDVFHDIIPVSFIFCYSFILHLTFEWICLKLSSYQTTLLSLPSKYTIFTVAKIIIVCSDL